MSFYNFVAGPLLWLSFAVFIIGLLVRIVTFVKVSREKDKIIYQHFNWRYVFLTFARWLMPINPTVAKTPAYFLLVYVFHFASWWCLSFCRDTSSSGRNPDSGSRGRSAPPAR